MKLKINLLVILFFSLFASNIFAAVMFPPLNDVSTKHIQPGKFIWVDLFSANVDASIDFYTQVFGWQVEKITAQNNAKSEEVYYHLISQGKPIAGIVPRPTIQGEEDKALWVGNVSVQNVKEVVDTAKRLGARVSLEPRQLGQRGIQAIIIDPQGGIVGLLHSDSGDPKDQNAIPGQWRWTQLFSPEPNAAIKFYSQVFGYEVESLSQKSKKNSYILSKNGSAHVGVVPLPKTFPQQNRWIGFVSVDSVDQTLSKTIALGGRVVYAPRQDVFDGQLAIIADSNGALIGVMKALDRTRVEK